MKSRDWSIPVFIGLIALALVTILFGGCGDGVNPKPLKFKEGEIVKHKLDGRRGMVIWSMDNRPYANRYKVRFELKDNVSVSSASGLLSAKAGNGAYADVWAKEYELEKAGDKR